MKMPGIREAFDFNNINRKTMKVAVVGALDWLEPKC
jgi:hypothetical protein